MEKKLAMVAFGGNALLRAGQKGTFREQLENVERTCENLLPLLKRGYDLGSWGIDGDCGQPGQMLAALLDWPQAMSASKVEVAGDKVKVTREIDGGKELLELALPAVLTADLQLNEPRHTKLPDIMKAKKKPLEKTKPADLGVDVASGLKVVKVSEPPARKEGIKVPDVAALVDKLRNEAKVI